MITLTTNHKRIQEGKNVKFNGSPGRFQQASAQESHSQHCVFYN